MIVFTKISPLQKHLNYLRSSGSLIGFVPTMGALHSGHLSLIQNCIELCDITVCSIYVNPTQFNEQSDLDNYPITTQPDLSKLLSVGADIAFLPGSSEIYPDGQEYIMPYDLGDIATVLEGANRPGHFEGVVQVVDRLLKIVNPSHLFMGQKDFQQFTIIQKMLELKDSETVLVTCPIIREKDGLAMSSRNVRLSKEERELALRLNKALRHIKSNYQKAPSQMLIEQGLEILNHDKIKVEYLSVVNSLTLKAVKEPTEDAVALVAAWVGQVRLLDNIILN